jgi:hypothetical protein
VVVNAFLLLLHATGGLCFLVLFLFLTDEVFGAAWLKGCVKKTPLAHDYDECIKVERTSNKILTPDFAVGVAQGFTRGVLIMHSLDDRAPVVIGKERFSCVHKAEEESVRSWKIME